MSTTTKNNLAIHLAWFNREKPFLPPPPKNPTPRNELLPPVDVNIPSVTPAASISRPTPSLPPAPPSIPPPPTRAPTGPPSQSSRIASPPAPPPLPPHSHSESDMSKIQLQSSSKRSKLSSFPGTPMAASKPLPASTAAPNPAPQTPNMGAGIARKVVNRAGNEPQITASNLQRAQPPVDVDCIDLTDDIPVPVSTQRPAPSQRPAPRPATRYNTPSQSQIPNHMSQIIDSDDDIEMFTVPPSTQRALRQTSVQPPAAIDTTISRTSKKRKSGDFLVDNYDTTPSHSDSAQSPRESAFDMMRSPQRQRRLNNREQTPDVGEKLKRVNTSAQRQERIDEEGESATKRRRKEVQPVLEEEEEDEEEEEISTRRRNSVKKSRQRVVPDSEDEEMFSDDDVGTTNKTESEVANDDDDQESDYGGADELFTEILEEDVGDKTRDVPHPRSSSFASPYASDSPTKPKNNSRPIPQHTPIPRPTPSVTSKTTAEGADDFSGWSKDMLSKELGNLKDEYFKLLNSLQDDYYDQGDAPPQDQIQRKVALKQKMNLIEKRLSALEKEKEVSSSNPSAIDTPTYRRGVVESAQFAPLVPRSQQRSIAEALTTATKPTSSFSTHISKPNADRDAFRTESVGINTYSISTIRSPPKKPVSHLSIDLSSPNPVRRPAERMNVYKPDSPPPDFGYDSDFGDPEPEPAPRPQQRNQSLPIPTKPSDEEDLIGSDDDDMEDLLAVVDTPVPPPADDDFQIIEAPQYRQPQQQQQVSKRVPLGVATANFPQKKTINDVLGYDKPPPPSRQAPAPTATQSRNLQGPGNLRMTQQIHNVPGRAHNQHAQQVDLTRADMQHPWSREVARVLKDRFHLSGFRQNQLEAINETLSGKNVFVIMPTGGGKSLIYQLPAIVSSGKTRGVTVVISPLLSLMTDQVDHLQKLRIDACYINGDSTAEEKKYVFDELFSQDPRLQLIYVTPEMLSKSGQLQSALERLYSNGRLARLVIDEAHCVSEWGHDFRPDYKELGKLRERYNDIPLVALTATATHKVRIDVQTVLKIRGCKVLEMSFNRPNLSYEVRAKKKDEGGKSVIQQIADICREHAGQAGIIYCFSRSDCEKLSEKLGEMGISCNFFHAGIDSERKKQLQKDWQANKFKIIVATIAFGMGIDKPDVRFVIHHSMPKSLEGYYQETGRAGRDGKPSNCTLFYSYADKQKYLAMAEKDSKKREKRVDWHILQRQREMLQMVVQYCDNPAECRRTQVLRYFGEKFDRANCMGGCDNCLKNAGNDLFEERDVTEDAANIVKMAEYYHGRNKTILMAISAYQGTRDKKDPDTPPGFGTGAKYHRNECERLFHAVHSAEGISETYVTMRLGSVIAYIAKGRLADQIISGEKRIKMLFEINREPPPAPKPPTRKPTTRKPTARTATSTSASAGASFRAGELELSTFAAPARGATRNGYEADGFIIPDDDEDDGDFDALGMPPVRRRAAAGTSTSSRAKKASKPPPRPITAADALPKLTSLESEFLVRFMDEAKKIRTNIMKRKGLQRVGSVFLDSDLQKIGIYLPRNNMEMCAILGTVQKVMEFGNEFVALAGKYRRDMEKLYEDTGEKVREWEEGGGNNEEEEEDYGLDDDDENYEGFFAEEAEEVEPEEEEYSEYFQQRESVPERGGDNSFGQWNQMQTGAKASSRSGSKRAPSTSGRGAAKERGEPRKYTKRTAGNGGSRESGRRAAGGSSGNGNVRARKPAAPRTGGGSSRGGEAPATTSEGGGVRPMWL